MGSSNSTVSIRPDNSQALVRASVVPNLEFDIAGVNTIICQMQIFIVWFFVRTHLDDIRLKIEAHSRTR